MLKSAMSLLGLTAVIMFGAVTLIVNPNGASGKERALMSEDLAKEIQAYLKSIKMRTPAEPSTWDGMPPFANKSLSVQKEIAPAARPRLKSLDPNIGLPLSSDADKTNALRSLDSVIQQDIQRDRRF